MSLQDIKDRVPLKVLANGAIRQGVYDENGKLLRYEYVKREDEPIEIGTPVNRALFANLQGDLYTQDRYNETVVTKETIHVDHVTDLLLSEESHTGNCIPSNDTDWIADDDTGMAYTSTDGIKLSTTSTPKTTAYAIKGLFTGAGFMTSSGSNYRTYIYATVDFGRYVKIKKLKYNINTNDNVYLAVYGINEDGTETAVYPRTKCVDNTATEIVVSAQGYYKAYKFQIYDTGDTNYVQAHKIEVTEYSDNPVFAIEDFIHSISLPLTSYEKGKKVNIKSGEFTDTDGNEIISFENPYLNINNLGAKCINGSVIRGNRYNLVYNGESWDFENSIISGTFTGNSTAKSTMQEINLGFKPKLLIVGNVEYGYCRIAAGENVIGLNWHGSSYAGYKSDVGDIIITENGFTASNGSGSVGDQYGFNYSESVYAYIALP